MAVLNKHHGNIPKDAIYIGRGSIWGNPFVMGTHGDRETVCAKHRVHLWKQIQSGEITLEQLAALHGKDLVCYCAPARCHGHALEKAAVWAVETLKGPFKD